jgi:hypothetical protein
MDNRPLVRLAFLLIALVTLLLQYQSLVEQKQTRCSQVGIGTARLAQNYGSFA